MPLFWLRDKHGMCDPSQAELSRLSGLRDERTVRYAAKVLRAHKLIEWRRRPRRTNLYTLLPGESRARVGARRSSWDGGPDATSPASPDNANSIHPDSGHVAGDIHGQGDARQRGLRDISDVLGSWVERRKGNPDSEAAD